MDQTVFQIVVGIAGFLGASILGVLWGGYREAQREISDLKVLVAGKYVTTESFERTIAALFVKLDRMESKLDGKADKP